MQFFHSIIIDEIMRSHIISYSSFYLRGINQGTLPFSLWIKPFSILREHNYIYN
uniref:Uncharacterized protein n=1 Tax=Picea glauca TaxID=3330 RepID=A0A101LY40_PICGL|nr:hypothetical protein ABT39_MTgene5675 [Picea glauca]